MSSSTNGINARPQVVDGEAVDPTDFNNMSAWSRAYLNDLVLGALARSQSRHVGPQGFGASPLLYSIGSSGAPRNGASTSRSIGCNAGPLFFAPGGTPTIDGRTPKVLLYYLTQNEITATLGAGDPTNPRFDAVYVRISEVDGPLTTRNFEDATGAKSSQSLVIDRRTKLEWTVVAGTPAAKPQIPAPPDATWAQWGVWWVPATFGASLFNFQHIYDYRIPMQSFTRHVIPYTAMLGSSWTIAIANGYASSTAGTGFSNPLGAYLPRRSGRVMGFSFDYLPPVDAGSFSKLLIRQPLSGSIITYPPTFQPNFPNSGAPFGDIDNYTMAAGLWVDASSFVDQNSATGYQLLPLWANGYGSEAEDPAGDGGSLQDTTQVVAFWCPNAAADKIISCSFDVAG